MNNNKLTPQQEEIVDTLHDLIWYRITNDEKYIDNIPKINAPDFHDWIYYIRYDFVEYDDSVIQAVVYLNGKHYLYTEAPQIGKGQIWFNEIEDSVVESKTEELSGRKDDYFELYDPYRTIVPDNAKAEAFWEKFLKTAWE